MLRTPQRAFGRLFQGATALPNTSRIAHNPGAWRRQLSSYTRVPQAQPWSARIRAGDATQPFLRVQALLKRPAPPSPLATRRLPTAQARRAFHSSRARRSGQKIAGEAAEGAEGGANARAKMEAEPQSLRARLRKLSREYGWGAVGVYLALSVLDFPFCFLLVRVVGTDRIAEIEHWVVGHVAQFIPESAKAWWRDYRASLKQSEREVTGSNEVSNDLEMAGWGVKEAEERNKEEASLATQLALAYAIHKSFIFVRVPLTAAITPKVVKVLRSWGWQIGKRKPKA